MDSTLQLPPEVLQIFAEFEKGMAQMRSQGKAVSEHFEEVEKKIAKVKDEAKRSK